MRTSFFRFKRDRISDDFPTFDLPTNANSGKDPLGYCFEETAPVINSVLITFMDIFSKKVRNIVLNDDRFNIKAVPCVLLKYENDRYDKFEGSQAFTWIKNIIEKYSTREMKQQKSKQLNTEKEFKHEKKSFCLVNHYSASMRTSDTSQLRIARCVLTLL